MSIKEFKVSDRWGITVQTDDGYLYGWEPMKLKWFQFPMPTHSDSIKWQEIQKEREAEAAAKAKAEEPFSNDDFLED